MTLIMELTGRIKKIELSGVTPFKIPIFVSFSGTDTTPTKEMKKKRAQWGNPSQNSVCYLQLHRLLWID